MGIDHIPVVQAVLWPELVPEFGVALQDVGRCANLGRTSLAAPFLGWRRHDHAGKFPNAFGFLAIPAQMNSQPYGAVERVHFMSAAKRCNVLLVPWEQFASTAVQAAPADA